MTEDTTPNAPGSPQEAFEQATQQAREFGEKAGEQMRQFGDQAASQAGQFEEQAEKFREASEQAAEQARAINEQILETARKMGSEAVHRYVDWLNALAEEQRKLATAPQVSELDWFASMLKAQADFTQEFAKSVSNSSLGQQQSEG